MARRKAIFQVIPRLTPRYTITAKVFYDFEYHEWLTRLYVNGTAYAPADYFTACQEDACATAISMVGANGVACGTL